MRHTGTNPIETPRLVLRRFTPTDATAMYQNWATDPDVARWMRWTPHKNLQETQEIVQSWVDGYEDPQSYLWAIQRKEDSELIGSIGIMPGGDGIPEDGFGPGYNIGQAFWGQGYVTEALEAIINYFFTQTGAQKLYCCHATANPASGRVLQKAGFVHTHSGVYHKYDGTEVPAEYYELVNPNA